MYIHNENKLQNHIDDAMVSMAVLSMVDLGFQAHVRSNHRLKN